MATEEFHQEAKAWATIKHTLLAKYLRLFVDKTGFNRERVFYVDAFAGPGVLDDGTKGSPIYAAELAARDRGKRVGVLHCINVEWKRPVFESLEAATAEYVEQGVMTNLHGRFEDHRDRILDEIGDAPALFFIDPFGTKGASLSDLALLTRERTIREVLVRYDDTRVKRLASWAANHAESMDFQARRTAEAFGRLVEELSAQEAVTEWLNGQPNARQALIDGYIAEAKRREIFRYGIAYPLRNPDTLGHRYFLVHMCNYPDGFVWMANFMNAADVELLQQHTELSLFAGQQELFTVKDLNHAAQPVNIQKILDAIPGIRREKGWSNGTRVQNRWIYAAIVDRFLWEIGRSEREGAIKQLASMGVIESEGVKDKEFCTFVRS